MIDPAIFKNTRLRGGFIIVDVEFTDDPLLDAIGREAIARTGIVGKRFDLLIRAGLDARELSITLYHEILEAAVVASSDPPSGVMDFVEADFERIAHAAHDEFGEASPENLNHLLQLHGFREESIHD